MSLKFVKFNTLRSMSIVLEAFVTSVTWLSAPLTPPVKFHMSHESTLPNISRSSFIASRTDATFSKSHLNLKALNVLTRIIVCIITELYQMIYQKVRSLLRVYFYLWNDIFHRNCKILTWLSANNCLIVLLHFSNHLRAWVDLNRIRNFWSRLSR